MKKLLILLSIFSFTFVGAEEILIEPKVSRFAPELDGKYDSAWFEVESYEFSRIGFKGLVKLRSLIHGDSIYFFLEWKDETYNKFHKPWLWDGSKGTYTVGPEREDTLVMRWGINIDNERINSANDVWMWGSVRTNHGHADDLYEIVSKKPLQNSIKKKDFDGEDYYLKSQGDVGDRCWTTLFDKTSFWLNQRYNMTKPTASRADVRSQAQWSDKDKSWTMELKRKLITSNFDDVEFIWEQTYYFDISKQLLGNAHIVHNISLFDDGLKPQDRNPLIMTMPSRPLEEELPKEESKKPTDNEKN